MMRARDAEPGRSLLAFVLVIARRMTLNHVRRQAIGVPDSQFRLVGSRDLLLKLILAGSKCRITSVCAVIRLQPDMFPLT